MAEKRILIVGLSDAGKTTYLGALNGALRQEGYFCLKYGGKSSNEDYLNKITEKWLGGEKIEHTSDGEPQYIKWHLKNQDDVAIDITVPDMKGEMYEGIIYNDFDENLNEYCKDVCGILLFVNNIRKPVLKDDANKTMTQPAETSKGTYGDQIKLTPENMSDVTKNILVVKYLKELIGDVRIVVAVSSWDMLTTFNTIQEYCEKQIAGLFNYVRHNYKKHWFCGVSAQGFAIDSYPQNLDELTSTGKRAYIFETEKNYDISKPLKYLIEE